MSWAAAWLVSSVLPSGRSRITWNSDLLSKGSILTSTARTAISATDPARSATTAP